jgi:hypothetical protein
MDGPATAAGAFARLRPGDPVRGVFVCARKAPGATANGDAFLSLTLFDGHDTFQARADRRAEELAAGFDRGDAVRVSGFAVPDGDALQIRLTEIERAEPRRPQSPTAPRDAR